MPLGDLYAMLAAANRIEARERLARITDAMVGAGLLKKTDARQHMRHLERQVRDTPKAVDRKGVQTLASFGIAVKRGGRRG